MTIAASGLTDAVSVGFTFPDIDVSRNSLLTSPDFYPVKLDRRRHLVTFIHMSRNSYRKSSFLDYRAVRASPGEYTVNLDDLLLYSAHQSTFPSTPLHYILHTAFCCSTLLCRYLELIPGCFVLKEPDLLTPFATASILVPTASKPASQGKGAVEEWQHLFAMTLRLLARKYSVDDVVVIKANDLCGVLGDALIKREPRSNIVFLSIGLRTFLLSVLKADERRAWLRKRVMFANKNSRTMPQLRLIDPPTLSDAEAGAYLWLYNQFLCQRLHDDHQGRVFVLDGAEVAERPERAVQAVAEFFGLRIDEGRLRRILDDPSVSRYSKNLSCAYDGKARRQELSELETRLGGEADLGMEWATRIGFDFTAMPSTAWESVTKNGVTHSVGPGVAR